MHAFKFPFTGLIVASLAMIIITLICYYSDNIWKHLSQSLIIVLIVKMLVSPHSMISAYFAVSFQAMLAFILYSTIGINIITVSLLTVLGLVESALQKILSLTVLFGYSIWDAVDALGNWIAKHLGFILPYDSSIALISAYVSIHLIGGILLGYKLHQLTKKISSVKDITEYQITANTDNLSRPNKSKKKNLRLVAITILLASLIIIVLYLADNEYNNFTHAIYIFSRTLLIIVIWYILLSPILTHWVKRFLLRKHNLLSSQVNQVFELIPYMRYITKYAWKNSDGIKDFIFKCLMYCLHAEIANEKT